MKIRGVRPHGAKGVDLLGVGAFEGSGGWLDGSLTLDKVSKEKLSKAIAGKKFSGKAGETFFLPVVTPGAAAILLVGLGKRDKHTLEKIRRASARLLGQAKAFRNETVRLELDSLKGAFGLEEAASAAVEGARLSDYKFDKYKSKRDDSKAVAEFELASAGDPKRLAAAIAEAETVSEGVLFTRDLANEPANVMTPVRLAQAAKEMAKSTGLKCTVLGLAEIKRLKMGGILGVSQGSSFPPQLIVLEHRVTKDSKPIVLVGKGVTFDTGGISIKPSGDMDKMKFDMCGAAAVIGTMRTVAKLKLPVSVVGIAPVVENMPGSKAQRPGDIVRISNGKTVEVLNTDAEGRLILADALAYAERYKPKVLVDIATLTGACSAAFGNIASGLMGTSPELVKRILDAGDAAGERCWELPLWEEYGELIRATYADIQNISKRNAGTITAGMFLKEFGGHSPWAHLDVAGTAWADSAQPLAAIGSTGIGVRLFVRLLKGYVHKP